MLITFFPKLKKALERLEHLSGIQRNLELHYREGFPFILVLLTIVSPDGKCGKGRNKKKIEIKI